MYKVIDLSGNTISSLQGLEGHQYLCEINMEDNKVSLWHASGYVLICGHHREKQRVKLASQECSFLCVSKPQLFSYAVEPVSNGPCINTSFSSQSQINLCHLSTYNSHFWYVVPRVATIDRFHLYIDA